MTPERWQQINQLFHSALERDPERRAAFLAEACSDDEELRREVESLLAADEMTEASMVALPAEVAAEWFADGPAKPVTKGQMIGHYQIRSALGAGGMGEVYLAQDTRLGRKVALKLLPAKFTTDTDLLRRFEREARAASALNHPNIVTVYEIGQVNNLHYIVTEFIEGQTLRQRLANGPMPMGEVLDVAAQIAQALDASHQAGVVHRDIKPENIMLRRDGYVKVLDFGIAKLVEGRTLRPREESLTLDDFETEKGAMVGTAAYMSPEQARALAVVDARTDIFSLGVVLYEMITGVSPFAASTRADMNVMTLTTDPRPLSQYTTEASPEIERIVTKALAKQREQRYQTVRELLADLVWLKQQLAVASEVEYHTRRIPDDQSVTNKTGPYRRSAIAAIVLIVVAVAVGAYALYRFFSATRSWRMEPFTSHGNVTHAVIAPNGEYCVYVRDDHGEQTLWVRQVGAYSDRQIPSPGKVTYSSLTFSTDNTHVYYVAKEPGKDIGVLYQIPALGGSPRKLRDAVDTPVTFSHDGARYAFGRDYQNEGKVALLVADANGDGNVRKELVRHDYANYFCSAGPAWSPVGNYIACSIKDETGDNVVLIQEDTGAETYLPSKWENIKRIAWLKDGSGLMIIAMKKESKSSQIFYVPYRRGEPQSVTNDLNQYEDLSVAADSNTFITVQIGKSSDIYLAPLGTGANSPKPITKSSKNFYSISWTPDAKIITSKFLHPNFELVIIDANGEIPLTHDFDLEWDVAASPDGRHIVFVSNRQSAFNIWRRDIDGRNPKRLTSGVGDSSPQFSPDGKWIYYHTYTPGGPTLWKISIDGGDPQPVNKRPSRYPVVSPDDNLIACQEEIGSKWTVVVIPKDGGPPKKIFNKIGHPVIRWTHDGRGLIYIDNRGSNLWLQPYDGDSPIRLTGFPEEKRIFLFDRSPDGKQLALLRGETISDAVIFRRQ